MPVRRREVQAGLARGRRLLADLCRELDESRRAGGLTYAAMGRAVGLSGDQVARICHGEAPTVGIVQLSTLLSTTGLVLAARAYPLGDPIRDGPQLALLKRFRDRLGAPIRMVYEVPVVQPAAVHTNRIVDLRAWDAVILLDAGRVGVEAETRLDDLQAVLRRLALKRRDGAIDRLIVVVNDTAGNRRLVDAAGPVIRAQFPGSVRQALAALRSGSIPAADTLLVL